MQAVILAGGKGTRLQERLAGRPKPLVDIGGIPLLERQMLLLQRFGFSTVRVLVNHAAGQIVDFCASRGNWGLDVQCIDDGEPSGTAGAVLSILDQLEEQFLVMYGDTMLEVDLARFAAFHAQDTAAAATLFLHPNDHPYDSDLVDLDEDGVVQRFLPYPHSPGRYYRNLVNAALYWVRRSALEPWHITPGPLDFGRQLFPDMLARGLRLRGYNSPEYIKDAGTPERLERVCADLASGRIARSALSVPQPVIFIDRDGTLNEEVDHLSSTEDFRLLPGVAPAIRRINQSDYRVCVITNQPVVARGECSLDELRLIHNKLDTLLGHEHAYIDRLYFCPHHPDSGFAGERAELKIECDCRKPQPGMIRQAVAELNARLADSWLIGDSTVDIETARRAGIKSVLVETGYAGMDGRYWAEPDYRLPDLPHSVNFILDQYPRLLEHAGNIIAEMPPGAMVLLGGQSRSGKSGLASLMRDALLARGQSAVVLSLDRWLRNECDRGNGVLMRYDLEQAQTILRRLVHRKTTINMTLPAYHKLQKRRVEAADAVSIEPHDVVLVEGTVALALQSDDGTRAYRFHLPVDESTRRERLLREYRLRGMTESAAEAIYQERMQDEYPVVEALASEAERLTPLAELA